MFKLKSLLNDASNDQTPPEGRPSPSRIASALRTGKRPRDAVFDRLLSAELRAVSSQHWTPVAVAVQAARWLDQLNVSCVVDIGSGPGKFCVVAALAGRARFVGIEQRERFVLAARELACVLEVEDRVSFINGTFGTVPAPVAEAYYLFNPFGENLYTESERLDSRVELTMDRYYRDIAAVKRLLYEARLGTYVVTYNGFGGRVPACFEEVFTDREQPNVLRMWRKTRPASVGMLVD